jgi:hypothetical protein
MELVFIGYDTFQILSKDDLQNKNSSSIMMLEMETLIRFPPPPPFFARFY